MILAPGAPPIFAGGFAEVGLVDAQAVIGIAVADIDWILSSANEEPEIAALQTLYGAAQVPLGGCCDVCGTLGPAEPVLNLLLAVHGMNQGKRLCRDATGRHIEESLPVRHVLLTARSPQGQYVAVIISAEFA